MTVHSVFDPQGTIWWVVEGLISACLCSEPMSWCEVFETRAEAARFMYEIRSMQ